MLQLVGTFVGGLGLFLLAVSMITDGLRLAAGDSLRELLARSTATRTRGVLSGMTMTALVQSSSATTLATIGFVNAGLLSLPGSLLVVYGANVGTTMTGWIVAMLGFGFDVEAVALPLIGIGMLVRVFRPGSRLAAIGEAAAGFGLFFIGVSLLSDAFSRFAEEADISGFAGSGGLGVLTSVVVGFVMTLITQSSSAAIAITLTAATGGLLNIETAAAMVIGANVGTTSTAALAVIGATPNARRLAAGHVVFNLLTGTVALLLLPLVLWLVRETGTALGMEDVPAVTLALFHSVFNFLGVILMLPLNDRLGEFLLRRFRSESERLSQPQFLDHTSLANAGLALAALHRELVRATGLCRQMALASLHRENARQTMAGLQRQSIRTLIDAIKQYVNRLELERLPEDARGALPTLLRICAYLEEIVGLTDDIAARRRDIDALLVAGVVVAEPVGGFLRASSAALEAADPGLGDFSAAELAASYEHLNARWHELKDELLIAAADRRVPISHLNSALEGLRALLKVVEQMHKAAVALASGSPEAHPAESNAEAGGAKLL